MGEPEAELQSAGPRRVASAIFCTSEEQRTVAEETTRDVDAAGHWPGKVVTEISEAGPFWEAEAEDQDIRAPGCSMRVCWRWSRELALGGGS